MSKERTPGMSVIVKTVTRLTAWLIMLYGVNIVLHGHVSPGGGFAGGRIALGCGLFDDDDRAQAADAHR